MSSSASLAIAGLFALGEPSLTIDWRAPEECPGAAAVAELTAGLLRARAAAPAELAIAATVDREGGRYRLALALRSTYGELRRDLESEDCLLLARAVALVAAVHLDPVAVSRQLSSPPPLPPLAGESAVVVMPAIRAAPGVDGERAPGLSRRTGPPPPPREPEGDRGGLLRLAGGLGLGAVPAVAGELALVGGAWGPRWRVEGGVTAAPRREVLVREGELGGRFARLSATLRGCAAWRAPSGLVGVYACVGAELGAIGAIGTRGVATPVRGWIPFAAVTVGPAVRLRLAGPVGLWLGVDAVVALSRPTFTAGMPEQTLFTGAPLGVRGMIGIDVQIAARKRRVRATD